MPGAGLRIAAAIHQGRRQYQEDRQLTWSRRRSGIFAVADGMGGHAAGDVASALAIDTLSAAFRAGSIGTDPTSGLEEAARTANERILAHATNHPESDGLGTTLVAAFVRDNLASIAHAGDSRGWLITADNVIQLTRDHSAVQASLDAGTISAEEAAVSPYRHAILRNLGDAEFPGLEHGEVELPPGSILLLTSDGAHGFLTPAEMIETLSGTKNLQEGLSHLLRIAFHNGSDDNMTLVACEVGKFPRSNRRSQSPPPIPGKEQQPRVKKNRNYVTAGLAVILVSVLAVLTITLWRISGENPLPGDTEPVEDSSPAADANRLSNSESNPKIEQNNAAVSSPTVVATAILPPTNSRSSAIGRSRARPTPTPEFDEDWESSETSEESEMVDESGSEDARGRPITTPEESKEPVGPNDPSDTTGDGEEDGESVPTPTPEPESPSTGPVPSHTPTQAEQPVPSPPPTTPPLEESSNNVGP